MTGILEPCGPADSEGEIRERVVEVLYRVGLPGIAGHYPHELSGGQRQRMAIARAVIRRPAVYLFDDSFSALDYATDAALRAALTAHIADATVVIVAQRVSTIRDADRIVVLDNGLVVGTGTHTELIRMRYVDFIANAGKVSA